MRCVNLQGTLYKGGLEYSRIHNRLLPNNLQAISQEYGRSF